MTTAAQPLTTSARTSVPGSRRIRVTAVFAAEEVSGPGRQLAAVAQRLSDADVELRVLQLWRRGRVRPPFIEYLEDHGIPCVPVEDRGPLDLQLPARVRRVLSDWPPDIVQSHGYKSSAVLWSLRRAGFALPWVGFFHGSTTETLRASLYHWLDRRFLASADRVVVMSGRQAADFRRAGNRVRTIYNAVVPLAHQPDDGSGAIPSLERATRPRVAVVGRLSPEKGVDLFLRACASMAALNPALNAFIVGDGPERGALERLADDLGMSDRVTFLGSVRHMDVVYRAIDLLVIPSRSEGLPNVLLEALAHDVPVVATDVGAIADVLTDSRGGRIVPPGSTTSLADAIPIALRECCGQDATAARRAMARRFSLAERVAHHRSLYDEVLESSVREPGRD